MHNQNPLYGHLPNLQKPTCSNYELWCWLLWSTVIHFPFNTPVRYRHHVNTCTTLSFVYVVWCTAQPENNARARSGARSSCAARIMQQATARSEHVVFLWFTRKNIWNARSWKSNHNRGCLQQVYMSCIIEQGSALIKSFISKIE